VYSDKRTINRLKHRLDTAVPENLVLTNFFFWRLTAVTSKMSDMSEDCGVGSVRVFWARESGGNGP